ncbi:hypothetical protein CC78DRAFT_459682, partial [Lojkania enalia]
GDESQPVCGQCAKKNRPCQYEAPRLSIRRYRPNESSFKAAGDDADGVEEDEAGDQIRTRSSVFSPDRRNSSAASATPLTAGSSRLHPLRASSVSSTLQVAQSQEAFLPSDWLQSPHHDPFSEIVLQFSRHEAALVHHYTQNLGSWLDASDASRRFTLLIPGLVRHSPILFHAILAFAARHRGDTQVSEQAYQDCLRLVIERLNQSNIAHDDALLCSIVILRVVEQLSVPATGSDFEQHLAGCAAILRASQGQVIDPSAPTIRDAAFWVHVRQCLYTATINQQPPNLDLLLQLADIIPLDDAEHPSVDVRSETAWANSMTWLCARVQHFCFGGGSNAEPASRMRRWLELGEELDRWKSLCPSTFDPIWSGPATEESVFPEAWFTAEWHVTSNSYYHFSRLLLIHYKPEPRFALRNVDDTLNPASDPRSCPRNLWLLQMCPFCSGQPDYTLPYCLHMGSSYAGNNRKGSCYRPTQ